MRVAVILLNWNGKADTLECLRSLSRVDYPDYFTVVADNGSTDDSLSAIASEFPSIALIKNGENLGFAEGNNRPIRYALHKGAEAVILLNNDTVVDPGFLSAFVSQADPIQGAKLYLYSDPARFDHLGGKWNEKKNNFDLIACRELDTGQADLPIELDYACGAALFIRADVLYATGLLEPRYFLYWEESDLCARAKRRGFSTRLCPKALVWHKVSASMTKGKPFIAYYWWRNRLFWLERNASLKQVMVTLFTEGLRLARHCGCLFFQLFFSRGERRINKRAQLIHTKACLSGVFDYLLHHF